MSNFINLYVISKFYFKILEKGMNGCKVITWEKLQRKVVTITIENKKRMISKYIYADFLA